MGGNDADVIVIGAGAVGAATAKHLVERGRSVVVLEKEEGAALHQSGRNSGVVHAGYHLKPGSMKARFAIEGGHRLKAYCEERGVACRENGILVVARSEHERGILTELQRRAKENSVPVRLVAGDALTDIEPQVRGVEGLHAPTAASFDARAYVHALTSDVLRGGGEILYGATVRRIEEGPGHATVHTTRGPVRSRIVVNAAGLHADRLAPPHLVEDVRIVPFRGYYAELAPHRRGLVRAHVYPAPDLAFPFVGVHLSHRIDGRVIVGPGAMLAFGREAYRFRDVHARDLADTVTWPGFWRLFKDPRFRGLLRDEVAKSVSLKAIWRDARRMVPALRPDDLTRSYSGVRAQMVHKDGRLVEDLLVRETERAVHVLNAVSPGLTASLAFGEHLADVADGRL